MPFAPPPALYRGGHHIRLTIYCLQSQLHVILTLLRVSVIHPLLSQLSYPSTLLGCFPNLVSPYQALPAILQRRVSPFVEGQGRRHLDWVL